MPFRWKGVTAFKLLDRFAHGEDIDPFLSTFAALDYNLLRVFLYTPAKEWHAEAWEWPDIGAAVDFLAHVRGAGFYTEIVLLTDDDPARITPARRFVEGLAALNPHGVLWEIGNEPAIHKAIDTRALEAVCEASGLLFSSGDSPAQHFGTYATAHTDRDGEWPRRAHDLLEWYDGGGPDAPTDPPHHCPIIADEPIRPDQSGYNEQDFRAYAGTCALLGGGATFHFESGKYGQVPTSDELRCAEAFADGLMAFPADAPLGAYERPEAWQPGSLRSYRVGPYAVRVRPLTASAPEPGWTPIDTEGVLWKR